MTTQQFANQLSVLAVRPKVKAPPPFSFQTATVAPPTVPPAAIITGVPQIPKIPQIPQIPYTVGTPSLFQLGSSLQNASALSPRKSSTTILVPSSRSISNSNYSLNQSSNDSFTQGRLISIVPSPYQTVTEYVGSNRIPSPTIKIVLPVVAPSSTPSIIPQRAPRSPNSSLISGSNNSGIQTSQPMSPRLTRSSLLYPIIPRPPY